MAKRRRLAAEVITVTGRRKSRVLSSTEPRTTGDPLDSVLRLALITYQIRVASTNEKTFHQKLFRIRSRMAVGFHLRFGHNGGTRLDPIDRPGAEPFNETA